MGDMALPAGQAWHPMGGTSGRPPRTVFDESWYTFDAVASFDGVRGRRGSCLSTCWRWPCGHRHGGRGWPACSSPSTASTSCMSTFITGGVLCAVLEYQRPQRRPGPGRGRQPGLRVPLPARDRRAAGAAVATKWTGLLVLVPVIVPGVAGVPSLQGPRAPRRSPGRCSPIPSAMSGTAPPPAGRAGRQPAAVRAVAGHSQHPAPLRHAACRSSRSWPWGRLGVGVGVAAVLAAVAYAPVWPHLPVPVGWLRLLPLVPLSRAGRLRRGTRPSTGSRRGR
jgi:hypothetical protein